MDVWTSRGVFRFVELLRYSAAWGLGSLHALQHQGVAKLKNFHLRVLLRNEETTFDEQIKIAD